MLRIHNDNHVERVKLIRIFRKPHEFAIEQLHVLIAFLMHSFRIISFEINFHFDFIFFQISTTTLGKSKKRCCLNVQYENILIEFFLKKLNLMGKIYIFPFFAIFKRNQSKKFTHIVHCDYSRYFWAALDCDNSWG